MNNEFTAVSTQTTTATNDNNPVTRAKIQAAATDLVDSMLNWDNLFRHEAKNLSPFDWERIGSVLNQSLKQAVPNMKIYDDVLEDFSMWLPYTRDVIFVRDTMLDITNSHLSAHILGDDQPIRSITKSLKLRLNFIHKQNMEPITPSSEYQIGLMVAGYDDEFTRKRDKLDVQRAVDAGLKL